MRIISATISPSSCGGNLFDVVISIRDHQRNENSTGPVAFLTEYHANLPDRELELAITRLAIPWYINFYMSWREYPNALLVRYEHLIASPSNSARHFHKGGLHPTNPC